MGNGNSIEDTYAADDADDDASTISPDSVEDSSHIPPVGRSISAFIKHDDEVISMPAAVSPPSSTSRQINPSSIQLSPALPPISSRKISLPEIQPPPLRTGSNLSAIGSILRGDYNKTAPKVSNYHANESGSFDNEALELSETLEIKDILESPVLGSVAVSMEDTDKVETTSF